jgi:hypothetical protein
MADNPKPQGSQVTGSLGVILGAIVALALVVFLAGGGEDFGKKTVASDNDLPPVAPGLPAPPSKTTGGPDLPAPTRPIVMPPPAR